MRAFIILILSCVSVLAADTGVQVALTVSTNAEKGAKVYHLVQTYIVDGQDSPNTTVLTAFILAPTDNSKRPVVFKTFDSKGMEEWLSGLPSGSIVIYDTDGFEPVVEPAKIKALKACCQKKGVSFY